MFYINKYMIQNKTKINNLTWVEKYRPNEFNNIIFGEDNKKILENILQNDIYPNLLFYGHPGTGKTTTIINIINQYRKNFFKKHNIDETNFIFGNNYLQLNASVDRGIEVIRNTIVEFINSNNSMSFNGHKIMKFIVFDEADYMTINAQNALKNLIQKTNSNVCFCLICNYIHKINSTLLKEFICFHFNLLPKNKILNFVKNICINENVLIDEDVFENLIDNCHDDIRKIINSIQINQHTKDWKNIFLSNKIFENIWTFLYSNNSNANSFLKLFCELSKTYKQNKTDIFISFTNYIIENKLDFLNDNYMSLINDIIHRQNNTNGFDDQLKYFYYKFREYLICK